MSSDFVSASFAHAKRIAGVAHDLRGISSAFATVGNASLADELWALGDVLLEEAKVAQDLCSEKVADDVRKSEEMTRAVIGAAFAGFSRVEGDR